MLGAIIGDIVGSRFEFHNTDKYDFEMLKGILENAVLKGELKSNAPVELLTHIIISELYGMMTCWCMSDGKFEPLEWTERFCRVQLNALIKQYICN